MDIVQKAINVTKSLVEFLAAGAPVVPPEVYKQRLDTCERCPKKTSSWTCEVCGCHIPIKAKMATESCPIRRWLALSIVEKKTEPCGGCKKKKG
jgi:hypothetical protein